MATTRKSTERKERGDSKLATEKLGVERHTELIQGLAGGWTYDQALDWLTGECGVAVSLSALTPFYQRHVVPVLRDRKRFAFLGSQAVETFAKQQGVFDAATILDFKEKAARMMRDPDADPEEARKWMETYIKTMAGERDERSLKQKDRVISQKDEIIAQSERRIAVLEKKAAFYDAAKKASEQGEGGITAEEMADIERRLKLL